MNKNQYKINIGYITQKIEGKISIFNGNDSILFTLNDTAVIIFEGIKLGWDIEKIVQNLNKKYDISEKEAIKDVKGFIRELKEKKIISYV